MGFVEIRYFEPSSQAFQFVLKRLITFDLCYSCLLFKSALVVYSYFYVSYDQLLSLIIILHSNSLILFVCVYVSYGEVSMLAVCLLAWGEHRARPTWFE